MMTSLKHQMSSLCNIVQFVSGVTAVFGTRVENSGGEGKLDNDIARGPVIMMKVGIFMIAYPFCINCPKRKKDLSLS